MPESGRVPQSYRGIVALLALAVLIRAVVLFVVIRHPDRAMSPDSPLYLDLGRHFVDAYVHADAAYLSSSVLRTPGYPFFALVWLQLFGGGVTSMLVAQNLLSLLCVAVTFVLARALAGPAAAAWAAALAALDPIGITYANLIRNEVLFTLVLVVAVLLWWQSVGGHRPARAAAAGLTFALAALVRPVATYLLLFLAPADLWLRRRSARSAVATVWLVAGFLVPIGGWVARNHGVAGSWTISSAEQVNLLYYSAAGAVAEETGEPRGDVAARMQMSLASTNPNPARRSTGASRATALSILIHHPQGAAVSSSRGLARLLFGPGTSEVRQLLAGKRGARLPLLSWPLAGYLLVLYLAVAAGVVRLIRTRNRPATVVLGSVALYFLMICTSPVAYSRFRAPLMPLFAIVAAIGIADVSRRRQGAPDLSGS